VKLRSFFVFCLLVPASFAQQLSERPKSITPAAPKTPNSHPLYRQLRAITVGSEAVAVNNLVLKRDVATFTFTSGSFSFLQPVNGKITGAVFVGNGSLKIEPLVPIERAVLGFLAKGGYEEQFTSVVFRFSDGTSEEIKKAASGNTSPNGNGELQEVKGRMQNVLHHNLDARVLTDVLTPQSKGIFWAFIKGKKYGDRQIFQIDPHGVTGFVPYAPAYGLSGFIPNRMGPSEVLFQTYNESNNGICFANTLRTNTLPVLHRAPNRMNLLTLPSTSLTRRWNGAVASARLTRSQCPRWRAACPS